MLRLFSVFPFLVLASACTMPPGWPPPAGHVYRTAQQSAALPAAATFRFDWRLSGDRTVAPLQVFDDGRHTWLQFAPGQPIPAIFARSASGDQLLSPARQDPYLVLAGVWPTLVLRGGHLQSMVQRIEPHASASLPAAHTVSPHPAPPSVGAAAGLPVASQASVARVGADAVALQQQAAVQMSTAGAVPEVGTASRQLALMPSYEVSPADLNMRLALARWAGLAGWTFEPEHWAVDVDIPLAGSASFDGDFKSAVQRLIEATEMADRPLQPCFYANKVLRIVALTQPCDRAHAVPRSS